MSSSIVPPSSSDADPPSSRDAHLLALVDRALAEEPGAWSALWLGLTPIVDAVTVKVRWMSHLSSRDDERDIVSVEVMGQLAADGFAALRAFREEGGRSVRRWIVGVAV